MCYPRMLIYQCLPLHADDLFLHISIMHKKHTIRNMTYVHLAMILLSTLKVLNIVHLKQPRIESIMLLTCSQRQVFTSTHFPRFLPPKNPLVLNDTHYDFHVKSSWCCADWECFCPWLWPSASLWNMQLFLYNFNPKPRQARSCNWKLQNAPPVQFQEKAN